MIRTLQSARARGRLLAAALALVGVAVGARAESTLRIAASRTPLSLPVYVALDRGYFRAEGLDVEIDDCNGGQRCLKRLLAGQDELATSAEMPVVLHGLAGDDLTIIATIAQSTDNLKLIARGGAGVVQGEQLDGRRVGVPAGTAAEYLLETHLLAVGVDPRRVDIVPMQAEDIVGALAGGKVDAVAVWEPFGYTALHDARIAANRLPLLGGYVESYALVVRRSQLARGAADDRLERLLRAIQRAEQSIQDDPAGARALLQRRFAATPGFVDWVWPGISCHLGLAQSLVTAMEGEARWAQREGHAAPGNPLNVLTFVYSGPLRNVAPAVVGQGL